MLQVVQIFIVSFLYSVVLIGQEAVPTKNYAIVIHGGAGYMSRTSLSPAQDSAFRDGLKKALMIGDSMLVSGSQAIDVVTSVIKILEDNPLFNAGKGSVFTHEGKQEMDASIMIGKTKEAGAVAGVRTIKNPITAARAVLEHSPHVLLVQDGAEQFAKLHKCEMVESSYFSTEARRKSLERSKKVEQAKDKHGTVGCVALDQYGNIVAATSTGGMTNKRYNRVGDSPIIGAGTYANEQYGISCTGHGEYFIRYAVAYDIIARATYGVQTFQEAAKTVVQEVLKNNGGDGGVIGLNNKGEIVMESNTSGMFRAFATPTTKGVLIYMDEK